MNLLEEPKAEPTSKKAAFITSIRQAYVPASKRTFLIVCASDGVVHWFANDSLRVNSKSKLFFLDRYFRKDAKAHKEGKSFEAGFQREHIHSDCTYIGKEKAGFVVGITSKSNIQYPSSISGLHLPLTCN